jgi:hypothetical protein
MVMAAQTGSPTLVADQCGMRDIEGIVAEVDVLLVAVPTEVLRDANPYALVLLVTAHAVLHTHRLSGFCELGLQILVRRMDIVGVVVALQTLFVAHWLEDKMRRGI